jgi:hypothetical protein
MVSAGPRRIFSRIGTAGKGLWLRQGRVLGQVRLVARAGLALLPWQETLDRQGLDLFCRYYLLHESGVSYALLRHWALRASLALTGR